MAIRPVSKDPATLVAQLSNRAAALAFASAFAVIVALVSLPSLVRQDSEIGRRIAASASLIVAVAVTGWAWRARGQLRAARQRSERPESPDLGAEPAEGARAGGEGPGVTARPRRSGSGGRP